MRAVLSLAKLDELFAVIIFVELRCFMSLLNGSGKIGSFNFFQVSYFYVVHVLDGCEP